MPESCPELPSIDGVDVTEQGGVAFVVLSNELTKLVEQRAVVESIERKSAGHELFLTRVFEAPVRALRRSAAAVVPAGRASGISRVFVANSTQSSTECPRSACRAAQVPSRSVKKNHPKSLIHGACV